MSLSKDNNQGHTHIALSVTVKPQSKELSPNELRSVGDDNAGVVTVEKVANGRLEVTVIVTRGWLHKGELGVKLPDIDRLNESQLAPVSTRDNVEFMARIRDIVNVGDSQIEFSVVERSGSSGTLE